MMGSDDKSKDEKAPAPAPAQELGMEDAFRYFAMIRSRFFDEPYFYRYFVSIVNEFKHGRIAISGLVQRVKVLFEEHPDLIEEFNKFLPPEHRITLLDSDDEQ